MVIKKRYHHFLQELQKIYNIGEAAVIADWVFENIASVKRTDILKNSTDEMEQAIAENIQSALQQLLQHKPVQYVLGEAWFYHMKLKVNEDVLIPRPETEELVQLIINNEELLIQHSTFNTQHSLKVLDIGTGSGCISIAIKKSLPAAHVTAIDISRNSLEVAKNNAAYHQAAIQFMQLDFLKEENWGVLSSYDIIVSNPPYIPLMQKGKLDKNVTAYEPHHALFVPDNTPFIFYEKMAVFSKAHLNNKGKIYVEIHENHAKEVVAIFKNIYEDVVVKKDIFGKERIVIAGLGG